MSDELEQRLECVPVQQPLFSSAEHLKYLFAVDLFGRAHNVLVGSFHLCPVGSSPPASSGSCSSSAAWMGRDDLPINVWFSSTRHLVACVFDTLRWHLSLRISGGNGDLGKTGVRIIYLWPWRQSNWAPLNKAYRTTNSLTKLRHGQSSFIFQASYCSISLLGIKYDADGLCTAGRSYHRFGSTAKGQLVLGSLAASLQIDWASSVCSWLHVIGLMPKMA